ncbi:MAG: deoxyguanosinetriphosphate triphosphohydrolase [Rickettsiaceae bacterium]
MFQSYACLPQNTRGRIYPEQSTPYRNEFERDRDRIIHANAFKRLQYKTQVFVNHEGDHYRNRMTHSVEVSTIARSLSKELGLCDDLAEGVALAHDLGHTPFGHAGEHTLNSCMQEYGGFSHNAHSFKILTYLEQKYAAYNGLNLTWEILEGIVKHNGPVEQTDAYKYVFAYDKKVTKLDLLKYSSAEAQVAALSDDIAYICHDLEDSIRADIVTYDDLQEIDVINKYMNEVKNTHKNIDNSRLMHETGRKLMHHLIESLLLQTRINITKNNIKSESDIRNLGKPLVEFTSEALAEVGLIKDFLMEKVYKHHRIAAVTLQCQTVVRELFYLYTQNVNLLPLTWRQAIDQNDEASLMIVVADYIAGMTDRFAIKQYQSFFNFNFASTSL